MTATDIKNRLVANRNMGWYSCTLLCCIAPSSRRKWTLWVNFDRSYRLAQGRGFEMPRLTSGREFESTVADMAFPFYTIGHSTRPIDKFIDILAVSEISLVIDVRTVPRSRTNPQYNYESLPLSLSESKIVYEHIAELGGLRSRARDIAPGINGFWENESFHNYADYAMSADFRSGLARLRELGRTRRCVVMCAEAVWWRCHRRIIADYLLTAEEQVFHILGPNSVVPASLTKVAVPQPDGALTYPAQAMNGPPVRVLHGA
jgi:hypothetical protein